ncbi:MAG: WYL domain-containing protein [Myxococcaceae bacterium]
MSNPAPEQRLLSLAAFLLMQEDPIPWSRIREEFHLFYGGSPEAAEKKWTRDKQSLLEVGIPIEHLNGELGGDGGYVIRPEAFQLRDLHLSPDEAAVLWTAANAAARMHEHPWRRHVSNACDKLRAACRGLPPGSSSDALPVRHPERADRAHLKRIVERIGEAVRKRKRVTLEYYTVSRGEAKTREVDIYGFAWRRGVWLFAGFCHLRQELRVFYVDHVRQLTLNEKKPAERDYEIPQDFDIGTFSRQQPWEFWLHAPLEAEVHLRGALAPIAERLLPGGRIEQSDSPTEVRVRLSGVRNLSALVRCVLSFGPEAELVSPERGRELARQMLALLAQRLEVPVGRSA